MKFDVTAVIKEIGAIETVGEKGFQKRNLILMEVNGQYENLVAVEFSGEKLQDPERYQVGQSVKVGGFINTNEWNGKYYTSLKGSFVQNAEEVAPVAPAMGQAGYNPQPVAQPVYQAPANTSPVTVPNVQAQPVAPIAQAIPANMDPPVLPQTAPVPQPVAQPQQTHYDVNGNEIPF